MTDIGFVNKAYVFNSTAGTSTAVPVPSGVANTHRLVFFLGSIASAPTITTPAGLVKLAEFAPGSTLKTAVFYRNVTASAEPASYTWTWGATGRNWGYALAYSGCDLAIAPTADEGSATDVTAGAGIDSPSVGVAARDWLLTLLGGREYPGTDTAKDWTNADTLDASRLNFYSSNTGTGAKSTAAAWDSGRMLTAGAQHRTITPSVAMQHVHLWSVRMAAQASAGGGGDPDTDSPLRMGLPRQ